MRMWCHPHRKAEVHVGTLGTHSLVPCLRGRAGDSADWCPACVGEQEIALIGALQKFTGDATHLMSCYEHWGSVPCGITNPSSLHIAVVSGGS